MFRITISILFILLIQLNPAIAGNINYLNAWDTLEKAKIKFQKDSTSFLKIKCSKYEKTLENYKDLQINLIKKKSFQFKHIIKNMPEKLKNISNSGELLNFKWSVSDENKIKNNGKYLELIKKINVLKKKSNLSPHWSHTRACISDYSSSKEFNAFLDELNLTMSNVDIVLSSKTSK